MLTPHNITCIFGETEAQRDHHYTMSQCHVFILRMATNPRQYIKRGSYVLFKFFVDGDALSEVTHKVTTEIRVLTLLYCCKYA